MASRPGYEVSGAVINNYNDSLCSGSQQLKVVMVEQNATWHKLVLADATQDLRVNTPDKMNAKSPSERIQLGLFLPRR